MTSPKPSCGGGYGLHVTMIADETGAASPERQILCECLKSHCTHATVADNSSMHRFNCSIHTWGRQMYDVDVEGSIAYSKGLQRAGVLTKEEQAEIERGLQQVRAEWASGKVSDLNCGERKLS